MKRTKYLLAARSALALCLVLGSGAGAQSAAPAGGATGCKAIVPAVGCYAKLHALCTAIDGAAVPPATQRDKDAMISTVVQISTRIRQSNLEQAIHDMDGLRQKLDQLSYAPTTRISDADSEKIGVALSAASFCLDDLN